jgi:hypothetical protein
MAIETRLQDTALVAGGEFYQTDPRNREDSRVVDSVIKFGRAAMYDGTAGKATVLSSTGGAWYGVAGRSAFATDLDTLAYAIGDLARWLKAGSIIVYVEAAVAVDGLVYARHTVDTGKYLGDFTDAADANKTYTVVGARYLTATTGAGWAAIDCPEKPTLTANT